MIILVIGMPVEGKIKVKIASRSFGSLEARSCCSSIKPTDQRRISCLSDSLPERVIAVPYFRRKGGPANGEVLEGGGRVVLA